MILVDPRAGSAELLEYIIVLPGHPPAQHEQLAYGDIAFVGNGPTGPMLVGLEVKNVGDALNCVESERFTGHQLPGLKSTYDIVYLVIQQEFRAAWDTGFLQIKLDKGKGEFWWTVKYGNRTWTHYEFAAWITMVEVGWGIRSRITRDQKETARWVIEMWKILQKPWDEHKTTNPFFTGIDLPGATSFVKPSLVERVVAQVDGIGPAKAREIGKRFPTVADMIFGYKVPLKQGCLLPERLVEILCGWKGIPGIGVTTAGRIIKSLWEGEVKSTKEEGQ